ncbi:MAG: pyridoxamine 5'-phosphate oxidase family protein [Actinomycetota bacterium]
MTDHASIPARFLDVDECWDRIRSQQVGRLVTVVAGRPDIFPVNYILDDDHIVIRTAEGSKLAGAIASAEVLFEIDHTDDERHAGWSVVVRGVAREPKSLEHVMHDQELDLRPWSNPAPKQRFIEVHPLEVSGRAVGGA